jgi:hypothetical protein
MSEVTRRGQGTVCATYQCDSWLGGLPFNQHRPSTITSVSVFETAEHQEESNRVAASWVKQALADLMGPVEISAGKSTDLCRKVER